MPHDHPPGARHLLVRVRRWARQAPVTVAIAALACAAWSVCALQSRSLLDTGYSALAQSWMLFGPELLTGWGWLRAVGFLFIHLDVSHLALNVLLGCFLGYELERALGSANFFAAWMISGLGSGLAVLFFAPLTPTAGMSGALYGLMVVLVGQSLRMGNDLRAPLALVAVNVAYTLLVPNVSLWGHLGGLAAGTVIACCFAVKNKVARTLALCAAGASVLAGVVGYVVSGGF